MGGAGTLANGVTEILKRLSILVAKEISLARGVDGEHQNLKKTIDMILAVMVDAEKMQVKSEAVRIWLKELKDIAYEADDILDEHAYKLIHQRQMTRKRDRVSNLLSGPNSVFFRQRIAHQIKDINKKLKEHAMQKEILGLEMLQLGPRSGPMDLDENSKLQETDSAIADKSSDEDESKTLTILKMSFDQLPSHLKRCFSYCTIFPKDSEIERETLIRLWIAEGFIQPSQGDIRSMEEIGNEYFTSLLLNSFFQEVKRDDGLGVITFCKMSNLFHDIALNVVGTNECSIVEASEVRHISELCRLRLLNFGEKSSAMVIEALKDAKKLRTIFVNQGTVKNIENVFNNNKLLRVLDLSRTQIEELPSSIGRLKHLRYLDLSYTGIKALPNSITRLYNLQTLNLTGCWNLNELPKDLNKLTNLRHLLYRQDYQHNIESLIQIPPLTNLQTLDKFTVPAKTIKGIAESEGPTSLEGELENLEIGNSRKERKIADKTYLKRPQDIKQVALTWSDETMLDEDDKSSNDSLLLEGLRPHPSLRSLLITSFMVQMFPKWMGDPLCLPNLVELELHSCNRCEQLPALGSLPFLKLLIMRGMIAIRCLSKEFHYGCRGTNVSFTLKKQRIRR